MLDIETRLLQDQKHVLILVSPDLNLTFTTGSTKLTVSLPELFSVINSLSSAIIEEKYSAHSVILTLFPGV